MTPAARLAAAIDILSALEKTAEPADRVVREFFRARRYAGSKDRAAVAERVFTVLRHRFSYAWRMNGDDPRRLVIASVLAEGIADESAVEAFFSGQQYAPAALTDDERSAISAPPRDPPRHVKGEFPPFLEDELRRALQSSPVIPGLAGDDNLLLLEMRAMLDRAPIDLRVNTLKTSRQALAAALEAEGFPAEPMPWSPIGLRLPPGSAAAKLSASPLFLAGAFEFQDEAAQIAALLCAAKPGSRVLDFAAGSGGKSLALAAAMGNQGTLIAHDVSLARLSMLGPRAHRAGATIIETRTEIPPPERGRCSAERSGGGPFDIVLLDSPCSGTGTWRRQPELRGRLTPQRLADLTALQSRLLDESSAHVAPGGRLIYATCSLLPCENEDQIAAFLSRHADFAALSAAEIWNGEIRGAPPPGLDTFFRASPHTTGTDGFFTAILRREP